MIDTVVLCLQHNQVKIEQPHLFHTNLSLLRQAFTKKTSFRSHQNVSAQDRKNGIYMPRINVHGIPFGQGTSYKTVYKVEFSVPKLMHGNNFVEVQDSDFETLIRILQKKLLDMGLRVTLSNLRFASVTSIHFSKNIILDDYVTVSSVIHELHKAEVKKVLDVSQTDYRNDGHLLRYHTDTFELVFYDKVKDLERSKISSKRSFSRDNYSQMHLLDMLKDRRKEVLRMEVRFGGGQTITSNLKRVGVQFPDRSFKYLFKEAISKKVLLYFWERHNQGLKYPLLDVGDPYDLLDEFKRINPGITRSQALQILGAVFLAKKGSMNRMRIALLFGNTSDNYWYRFKKDKLSVLDDLKTDSKYLYIQAIARELSLFQRLSIFDYSIII